MNLIFQSWIYLSFLLALLVSLYVLGIKYISTCYDDTEIITMITLGVVVIAGLISFIILIHKRKKVVDVCKDISINNKGILFLIPFIGILIILKLYLGLYVYNKPKNPVYAQLIINTNIIFIILLSILFFGNKISYKSMIGCIITFIGLGIVILDK
jgi:uncharacterized membrane protein